MRKGRIPMSVHIKYETPKEVAEDVYELVLSAGKDGVVKCGSNEVTKAAERGNAKIVILAEDVNPPELLAHLPMICDEKNIPYAYVPSPEFLAKEAGLPKGVKAASIAIMELSKDGQGKMKSLVEKITALRE